MIISTHIEAQASQQSFFTSDPMISRMEFLASQIGHLLELCKSASFIISRHQHDQLLWIQKDQLITCHDLLTSQQLSRLGLSGSIEKYSPYTLDNLQQAIASLELRLDGLKNKLFWKKPKGLPLL